MLRAHVRAVLANDRAVRLFREGRLGEAIAMLQRGLEANPPYATGYSNLGFLYLCQGQLDQATACLLHALEVDPRHPDAPDHLVDVLRGLIDELMQIGFNEGFLALHPGAHFDHHHRHLRAQEIGKLIATIGAGGVLKVTGRPIQTMQLLQLVIYRVQQQLCDHRQAVNLADDVALRTMLENQIEQEQRDIEELELYLEMVKTGAAAPEVSLRVV